MRLESQMLNETFNNIPEEQEISDKDTIIYTSGSNGKPLLASIEKEFDLNQIIRKFYWQDKIYSKILENPKAHAKFGVKEGSIFTKNNLSRCYAVILGANDGVAKSKGGDVGGTWLQHMCCALPKRLCP